MTIDLTRKLPRPDGHHTVTPGVICPNASAVLELAERAFGGKVGDRFTTPDGKVAHAEVRIGDAVVMVGDPVHDPAMPASLALYVDTGEAVDTTYQRALSAGAKSVSEPKNMFYGYRSATVQDAGRNRWTICAVVEQVSHDEQVRRMQKP